METQIRALIDRKLSQREIAKELDLSHTATRYWLKKFGLTTNYQHRQSVAKCLFCPKTVHGHRLCSSCRTQIRRIRVKLAAVKYLGNQCKKCGWQGHVAGYQFHHRDPTQKDFTIGSCSNKSWDVLKKELDKCDLLCAICHQIHHSTNRHTDIVRFATEEYQGRLLDFSTESKSGDCAGLKNQRTTFNSLSVDQRVS